MVAAHQIGVRKLKSKNQMVANVINLIPKSIEMLEVFPEEQFV